MIKFSSEHYEFMTFDPKRLDHVKAKCFLRTNIDVRLFLNDTIDMFLVPDSGNSLTDSAFLVARDDKICGYIALFDYFKYLTMHYAVIPSYRGYKFSLNETTGCSILRESSYELFKMVPAIEFIKLDIDINNIRSKKTALNAGYNIYNQTNEMYELRKYRK